MKKILKYILVTSLLIVSVLSLCSCKELDNLRKTVGTWDSKDHSSFVLNGKTYEKISRNDSFDSLLSPKSIKVADSELPLLVAAGDYSADVFRATANYECFYDGNKAFCEKGKEEALFKKIKEAVFETYAYLSVGDNFQIEAKEFEKEDLKIIKETLASKPLDEKEAQKVIEKITPVVYEDKIDGEEYTDDLNSVWYPWFSFFEATSDLLVRNVNASFEVYDIDEKEFYLIATTFSEEMENGGDVKVYLFDKKYNEQLSDLFYKTNIAAYGG